MAVRKFITIVCCCAFTMTGASSRADDNGFSMNDLTTIQVVAFIRAVALEEETSNDWLELKKSWYASNKRPLQFFEEILASVDSAGIIAAGESSLDESRKEEMEGLPMALIWTLLARESSLRLDSLTRFSFRESADPEDAKVARRLAKRRMKENSEKRKTESAKHEDTLLQVKLAILKWMASPESGSRNWSAETRKRVLKRLHKGIKELPTTAQGYCLKEGMRKAMIQVRGELDVAEEVKTPVWSKAEFKE